MIGRTSTGKYHVNNPSVINASPLIFLSRTGYTDFLHHFYNDLLIPQPVADEIFAKGKDDITVKTIKNTEWLKIVDAPTIPDIILKWGLGKGESSVLSLAYLNRAKEAVIDDLAARKCASLLNIPVRGTLGIILVLKKRRIIKSARPIIQNLVEHGMYLSPTIIEKSLQRVGE